MEVENVCETDINEKVKMRQSFSNSEQNSQIQNSLSDLSVC